MTYRVLVVDDAAPIRARLVALLTEVEGVVVCGEAEGGTDAVAAIGLLEPDAVILDIQMPKGNGFAVLDRVSAFPRRPRFIVCTNYPYPQYRQRAMSLGATAFLDKAKELLRVPEIIQGWAMDEVTS